MIEIFFFELDGLLFHFLIFEHIFWIFPQPRVNLVHRYFYLIVAGTPMDILEPSNRFFGLSSGYKNPLPTESRRDRPL